MHGFLTRSWTFPLTPVSSLTLAAAVRDQVVVDGRPITPRG